MKIQQTTISEVKLVYRAKVKASKRLQVKCSKDAFDIFIEKGFMYFNGYSVIGSFDYCPGR